MKVEIKPKYFPLIQKPMMCCVTCLQMILFRHGYKYTQDYIAKGIGKYPRYKTVESADKINSFFEKEKLPFKVEAFKISQIKDPKEFIINNLKKSNDVWAESCNKPLHNSESGHDILIQSIKDTTLTVVDPLGRRDQIYTVTLKKLTDAMDKKHDGRERGFMVVDKK
ncbi:MAG: C39 family peptidase [Candidatus Woesearchaeota archaeon]|nr:MAG: C39 family peptidase [Candidatus Woesearchaeota archaeon]